MVSCQARRLMCAEEGETSRWGEKMSMLKSIRFWTPDQVRRSRTAVSKREGLAQKTERRTLDEDLNPAPGHDAEPDVASIRYGICKKGHEGLSIRRLPLVGWPDSEHSQTLPCKVTERSLDQRRS